MGRAFFFAAVLLGLLVARLPASLMDSLVAAATDGRLRIAHAEGSFWRGTGILATATDGQTLRAWRALGWRADLSGWWRGEAAMSVQEGKGYVHVRATFRGIAVDAAEVDLPVAVVAALIPHSAAAAGWRGNLAAASPGLDCDWRGRCNGNALVLWQGAGVDIVPEQRFGDYELHLTLTDGIADLALATRAGDIRITGRGQVAPDGQGRFDAEVEGPPPIVDRIPNVMNGKARSAGTSGRVLVSLP